MWTFVMITWSDPNSCFLAGASQELSVRQSCTFPRLLRGCEGHGAVLGFGAKRRLGWKRSVHLLKTKVCLVWSLAIACAKINAVSAVWSCRTENFIRWRWVVLPDFLFFWLICWLKKWFLNSVCLYGVWSFHSFWGIRVHLFLRASCQPGVGILLGLRSLLVKSFHYSELIVHSVWISV